MKKLILMTSALTLMGGTAFAQDISVSAEASVSYGNITSTFTDAGSGLWSDAVNWSDGIPRTAGDKATINGNVSTLGGNFSIGTLTLNSTNDSISDVGTLTLDNGWGTAVGTSGSLGFFGGSSAVISGNGNDVFVAPSLTVLNGETQITSGFVQFTNGSVSGVGSFSVGTVTSDAGLSLSTANSFSGGVKINSRGTVYINNGDALGSGTLTNNGSFFATETLTLVNGLSVGTLSTGTFAVATDKTVIATGELTLGAGSTLSFGSTGYNGTAIMRHSVATINLADLQVNFGTLDATYADGPAAAFFGSVTIGSNGTLKISSGNVLGTGTITNSGTLILTANTTVGQDIVVMAGQTGTFSAAVSTSVVATGNIKAGANSTIAFGTTGQTGTISLQNSGVEIDATASVVVKFGTVDASPLGSDPFGSLASVKIENGAILKIDGGASTFNVLTGAGTLTNGGAIDGTVTLGHGSDFTGSIIDGVTNNLGLSIDDGVTVTLSGNNRFTGGISIAGTLNLGSNNAAGGATGFITTTGSTIVYTDGVNNATPININSNTTQLQVTSGKAEQSGAISETSGPRPLKKNGAGTLVLSAANTYTGTTTVTAGTLDVVGSIGSAAVIVDGGATLKINGPSLDDTAAVTVNNAGILIVSGAETIANLTNNGATKMQNTATGDTLTVRGDYSGTGSLSVDIDFGTDVADRLVIGGNVTGASKTIAVANLTTGIATGHNIVLIDVNGITVAGDFTLTGGPVTSGLFDYSLALQGSQWLLAGAINPTGTVYQATPILLGDLTSLGSFQDRINQRTEPPARSSRSINVSTQNGPASYGTGWFLVRGENLRATTNGSSQIQNNTWGIQVGRDYDLDFSDAERWVLGINAQYGGLVGRVTNTGGTGSIDARTYGVGITATWYGASGSYIDMQGQTNWITSDISSSSGAVVSGQKSTGRALSFETGHAFALNAFSYLIPQIQLQHSVVNGGTFTDNLGNLIDLGNYRSTVGRVGIAYKSNSKSATRSLYASVNISHNFAGSSNIAVSGVTTGLASKIAGSWLEVELGGMIQAGNEYTNFFGNISYRRSLSGGAMSAAGVALNFGLKVLW